MLAAKNVFTLIATAMVAHLVAYPALAQTADMPPAEPLKEKIEKVETTNKVEETKTEAAETTTVTTEKKTTVISKKPRVALVLGGGGARGAAHVGVIKVLMQENIPIDMVVGTSIGSVVGGMYAAGIKPDDMQKVFEDASLMRAFMTVPVPVRVAVAPVMFAPRLVGHHAYDGLYKGGKFRTFMNELLPAKERDIENLPLPYAAICLNVVDGKTHRITKGSLSRAMQASTAVPGLRKPVEIDGQLFVDGGVISNVPVDHAKEMGADFVIAVNIDERVDEVPLKTFRAAGSISRRMVKLQLAALDAPQCAKADIVIHPNVDGISLISRSRHDGVKGVEAGEKAAKEALPELKLKLSAIGFLPAQ